MREPAYAQKVRWIGQIMCTSGPPCCARRIKVLRFGSEAPLSAELFGVRENLTCCLTVKGLLPTHATEGDWQVCAAPVIPVIAAFWILSNFNLSFVVLVRSCCEDEGS